VLKYYQLGVGNILVIGGSLWGGINKTLNLILWGTQPGQKNGLKMWIDRYSRVCGGGNVEGGGVKGEISNFICTMCLGLQVMILGTGKKGQKIWGEG